MRWNSGGLWRNWGGTQGSAQRWNCGGAAVVCGGTAEGSDTERNCTNTCTHLQVEHRNKLYKYQYYHKAEPITKQNQLQNKTNPNCTNSKPIQQQINSIPTRLKINSILSPSLPTQCKLNPIVKTQSNSINYIKLNPIKVASVQSMSQMNMRYVLRMHACR